MTVHQALNPRPDLLSVFLASGRAFRGIGPKRAAALVGAFGPETMDAIRRIDPEVIEIVGEEAALVAAAEIELREPEVAFLAWLEGIDARIPAKRALRLARAWGPQGIADVQADPYLLLAIATWAEVERVARALGVSLDDPRRETTAIEAVLTGPSGLEAGHTGLDSEALAMVVTRLLGRTPSLSAIDRAVREGGAIRNGGLIQPPGAAWMEADLASRFFEIAAQTPPRDPARFSPDRELSAALSTSMTHLPFPLTGVQKSAVAAAHAHKLMVLAGYAGSGKTTVLRIICDTLEALGRQPTIVALSGRAAQRASEATGRKATTVAAFLHRRSGGEAQMGPQEVLIADEASMLSTSDIWRLVCRLGDASLILCGDPAQLPPIGPGLVFHTLCAEAGIPRVVLDRVMRQTAGSGIPVVAEQVRHGQTPDLPGEAPGGAGVSFISCRRGDLTIVLERLGRALRSDGVHPDQIQIIAPTNAEGGLVNAHFHQRRRARGAPPWPGHNPKFVEGDPVIWRENDASRGLVNGSLGRILTIDSQGIRALFDNTEHRLSPADQHLMDLAYAITVHKSQGSQWPVVIVPVFPGKLLDRTLLYTAITRASRKVVLIGDRPAFLSAVCRAPKSQGRITGLPQWLRLARDLRAPPGIHA